MGSLKYLNGVLTIIAVLLTLNLWTTWNTTPAGQTLSIANQAQAAGFANPDAQREEMIGLLKKIDQGMADMQKTLTDGSVKAQMIKKNGN